MTPEGSTDELLARWAGGLAASLHPGAAAAQQRQRQQLLQRAARSAAAHAVFTTIRREQHAWQPAAPGVTRCELRTDAAVRLELLRLAEGAAVPRAEAPAHEWLLAEGSLADVDGGATAMAWDHAVVHDGAAQPRWQARTPALLYRRLLQAPASALPPPEAAWWHAALSPQARTPGQGLRSAQAPGAWQPICDGVQGLPLQVHAGIVSMLLRAQPGARLPDHGHLVDEDCLMLQGEMALGDILLRAGDYQLAPAGSTHRDGTSDAGACFYFHGALEAALLPA